MRRSIRISALATLALSSALSLAATGSLPAEPAARAAQEPSAGSSCWDPVSLPKSARHGRLTDVFEDGNATWALGVASEQRGGRPIALRRQGGRWQDISVPWRGVSGLMAGDSEQGIGTWAVGFVRPGESLRPIAGRSRGRRWVDVPVPDPPGSSATLVDVEVRRSGVVWAVGARLQAGRTRAYALTWNRRWRRVDPRTRSQESSLTAVESDPGGAIWAVGWQLSERFAPLILRAGSDGWEPVPVSGLPDGDAVLTDLDFRTASDGYAAGYLIEADRTDHIPLLLRWDGSTWTRQDLPWASEASAILHSVAIGSRDDLLVTGARVAGNQAFNRAFVARHANGRWAVDRAGINPFHNSELLDGGYFGPRPMMVGSHAVFTMAFSGCAGARPESPPDGAADRAERADEDGQAHAPPLPGAGGEPQTAAVRGRVARVRFEDVSRTTGVREVTETWGGVSADFDGDGWTDVFYSRHNKRRPRLLLGGPDGFHPPPRSPLRDRDRHGCAAADVDADGWVDLFCAHGANRGTSMTSDELWLRPASRRPLQVTADYGVVDPFGRGRHATFFDLDGDPYPDLYLTNEPERADALPAVNRLYRNDAGRRYVAVPELGLDRSLGGDCATSGDVDSDGDDDLLLCATQPWRGPAGLKVFRNDGGKLREATKALGLRSIGDQDVVVADFDGDGQPDDVAQVGVGELRVSVGGANGFRMTFRMTVRSGVALGAGDVNADGRADLYVVRAGPGNQPDILLLNARNGRGFRRASIPQVSDGVGDDVIVIDHDRNGLDDFLVLNGRMSIGPVQLIASYRGR